MLVWSPEERLYGAALGVRLCLHLEINTFTLDICLKKATKPLSAVTVLTVKVTTFTSVIDF